MATFSPPPLEDILSFSSKLSHWPKWSQNSSALCQSDWEPDSCTVVIGESFGGGEGGRLSCERCSPLEVLYRNRRIREHERPNGLLISAVEMHVRYECSGGMAHLQASFRTSSWLGLDSRLSVGNFDV